MVLEIFEGILNTLSRNGIWSFIDILVVALIIYGGLALFRGTSAVSVLYGFGLLLVVVLVVSGLPHLSMLNWLLSTTLPFLSIALVVVFQQEIRRAMERIGRIGGWLTRPLGATAQQDLLKAVGDISRACARLSELKQGAIIVLERETGLQEYIEQGVRIDGRVSSELLMTIFLPNSPLHDAAVIVRGNSLVAAGCVLPLSEEMLIARLGTRHRAAVGISEVSDSITVVVSEESGVISIVNNGRMMRNLDEAKLRKILSLLYASGPQGQRALWPFGFGANAEDELTPDRSSQAGRRTRTDAQNL
jgi:diadenylate cyclase